MKSLCTAALLMLLGVTNGIQTNGRVASRLQKNYAESSSGVAHSCRFAIDRLKTPANYQSILGTGVKYTDTSFPTSEVLRWTDYPKSGGASFSSYATAPFYRISEKFPSPTLYGTDGSTSAFDIYQGQISDCYWITATSSMAQTPARIKKAFINTAYSNEGLFAINLYIKGKPVVVTIDDYVPFWNGNLLFNHKTNNGDFWPILLEKAWAKVNGNYENINWGWQSESFRHLTNAPTQFFYFSNMNYNLDTVWNTIADAIKNNYLIGVDTSGSSLYNLPTSHAYTVLGQYVLKDANGVVTNKLYRVRNPWNMDVYNGPWNDNDARWTAALKAQVPFAQNTNDGGFYIEDKDFVRAFYYFQIGYVHDTWNQAYSEVLADTGAQKSFTFTTTTTQELYVTSDFYHSRMYPQGCKYSYAQGALEVWQGATKLSSTTFTDQIGHGSIRFPTLAPGTYTIKMKATWTANDVREYTVGVYSPEKVSIKAI